MPHNCPRCAQVNPDEALYCWLDGAALDGPAPAARPVAVGAQLFPFPFVFISGRSCRNFDELVLACEALWDEAGELLRDGFLDGFLDGVGRADLADVARRCARETDPNAGLDCFLARLPGEARKPPRLAVHPQEFNLGQIAPGTDRRFDLCLKNEGMGLLTGWVVCSGADWLVVGDGAAQKVFQCRDEVHLTVRVVGDRLRAGPAQEGHLFIGSCGGPACVSVRVETPIVTFTEGVLAGADSPKVLAAKAKAAPVQAAVYFENGAVAAWYKANGWTFPVSGPVAPGVAAVQQYFEALGLSAPPRIDLDRFAVELEGPPGAPLETAVTLQAVDARPVFAHAVSLAAWLQAGPAVLAGRTARIPLRVVAVPDQPGEQLLGQVQITANGNQHFIVEVALKVSGRQWKPDDPIDPLQIPLPEVGTPGPSSSFFDDPPAPRPGRWMWAVAGGLLVLALAAATTTAIIVLGQGGASGVADAPPTQPAPPEAAGVGVWEDAPPGAPFTGHSSPILAAAFTTDGNLLTASGGTKDAGGKTVLAEDNRIHLWNAVTGREIKRLRGFKGGVAAAAFSADGHIAALSAIAGDHAVHLWDLREGRELRALPVSTGNVLCLAFTPDGGRIVSGGADGTIRVWEVETGDPLNPLKGHDGPVNSVAVSPEGRYVLSGGGDHTVRLWDLRGGKEIRQYLGHKDIIWATAFSPDGRFAVSAGGGEYNRDHTGLTPGARDFAVRLWEVTSGQELRRFSRHADAVGVAAFSPDGERVLTAGNDAAIYLWRTADAKELQHFSGHKDLVRVAAFFPDGRRALTGGDDAALRAWDLPASASELLKLLTNPDAAGRLRAVRDLADYGPEAAPAFRPLLQGLKAGDDDFRRAALLTLPKIGAPTRFDADVLEDLVKDGTFPAGRDYALDALATLGSDARPAALALYKLVLDVSAGPVARCKAARALAGVGPNPDVRAFVDLFQVLRDPNPKVSAAAADALAKLCPPGKEDVPDLNARLRDDSAAVRRYALLALAAVGTDARDAAAGLEDVLAHDPLADLRLAALKALLAVAPNDPGAVAALSNALADSDATIPPEAVKGLAMVGVEHGALPALLRALGHKDDAVRKAAEAALKTARLNKTHGAALGAALKTDDAALRERVLGVVEALGPDAGDAVPGLCVLLREGPANLRRRVIDVLAQLGGDAKRAGAALSELLKDKELHLAAAHVLATSGASEAGEAVPFLIRDFWDPMPDNPGAVKAREDAARDLVTIGKAAVPPVTAALRGFIDDRNAGGNEARANAFARLAAVGALREIGPDADVKETRDLLQFLTDEKNEPSGEVREAAAEALRAIRR